MNCDVMQIKESIVAVLFAVFFFCVSKIFSFIIYSFSLLQCSAKNILYAKWNNFFYSFFILVSIPFLFPIEESTYVYCIVTFHSYSIFHWAIYEIRNSFIKNHLKVTSWIVWQDVWTIFETVFKHLIENYNPNWKCTSRVTTYKSTK